jgi:hypothetical protein
MTKYLKLAQQLAASLGVTDPEKVAAVAAQMERDFVQSAHKENLVAKIGEPKSPTTTWLSSRPLCNAGRTRASL